MVKMVEDDPFIPYAFQKDHKGMQGTEYFEGEEHEDRVRQWLEARDKAMVGAANLHKLGVTKQVCNRILEPFMWHKAIVTATDWDNFFNLRAPIYQATVPTLGLSGVLSGSMTFFSRSRKDLLNAVNEPRSPEYDGARFRYNGYGKFDWLKNDISPTEIHFRLLAEAIWDARNESTPTPKKVGEWHIPFGDRFNRGRINHLWESEQIVYASGITSPHVVGDKPTKAQYNALKLKIATARCARVSYYNYEGKDDYAADIKLYNRLFSEEHMSPFEHCARVPDIPHPFKSGNFTGFEQYRQLIDHRIPVL